MTSYDELPYIGQTFPFTHPDHLATVTKLMGLNPIDPDKCRVLELGCGDGRNLLPMASSLPWAELLGIDLSATHIHMAEQMKLDAELTNVHFQQMDLNDVTASLGEFDYIVCHGVMSWVPAAVRTRIFEICQSLLSRNGVALISFNAFPGWHVRRMIRDMARLHIDQTESPANQLKCAHDYLRAFAAGNAEQSDFYGQLLQREVDKASRQPDFYFFHEYLEDINQPFYLHEIVEQAGAHDLRYIADAELPLTLPVSGAPAIETFLAECTTDRVSRDQHLDFLTNRTFRKSLFCRSEHSVMLDPLAHHGLDFFVSSGGRSVLPVNITDNSLAEFRTFDGETAVISEPLVKAAFLHLTKVSPSAITVEELLTTARSLTGRGLDEERSGDLELLMHWIIRTHRNAPASLIHLCCVSPRYQTRIPEYPYIDFVTRNMAEKGEAVANRRHERLGEDDSYRLVLPMLDGSRSISMISSELSRLDAADEFSFHDGESSDDAAKRLLSNFLHFGLFSESAENQCPA